MITLGILLDLFFPDPQVSWHPIALIGRWIAFLEKQLREKLGATKRAGILLVIGAISLIALIAALLSFISQKLPFSSVIGALLIFFLLCSATLRRAGAQVRAALEEGDLPKARTRLSGLVGRDTRALSEEDVLRAVIETMAENAVDGLIAPVFYLLLGHFFGRALEFGAIYKCVNTLDSMVGYRTAKYVQIGRTSAKLDDLLNYLPARIGAGLLLLSGALLGLNWRRGLQMVRRDARKHLSPNSGWPEAASAGLLGIRLGGSGVYHGEIVEKAELGDDLRNPEHSDIQLMERLLITLQLILLALSILIRWGV